MANNNMPRGFEPYGRIYEFNVYQAQATIYPGDLVKQHSAGQVAPAAASDAIKGVAMTYAASGADVLVADHPDQRFTCQGDDSTIDAQTDIGLNYDFVVGSASTTYRRSGMQVDASTQATTATLPLKLIGIDRSVDNALGSYVKGIYRINNHQNGSSTGVAGV